jgi:DtxR family Mn-dependent transcriptional regulator
VCAPADVRHNVLVTGELIDTTEMYLRTVFELVEEGTVPMRARIAERLGQSGPTVSQTVARMQRDGLLVVSDDRHLEFTEAGLSYAVSVMRKHRLAECLLVDVIGMPWEDVHEEACRWEHVMSEAAERRIWELLGRPSVSPYGNPIPGLDHLGEPGPPGPGAGVPLAEVAAGAGKARIKALVRRIDEPLQTEHSVLASLSAAGALPGSTIGVATVEGGLLVEGPDGTVHVAVGIAEHISVEPL